MQMHTTHTGEYKNSTPRESSAHIPLTFGLFVDMSFAGPESKEADCEPEEEILLGMSPVDGFRQLRSRSMPNPIDMNNDS